MTDSKGVAAATDLRDLDVLITGINFAPEPTGIAPYTAGMAQGLSELGARVRVVSTLPHYPQWELQEGTPAREPLGTGQIVRLRPRIPRGDAMLARLGYELNFGWRSTSLAWNHPDVVITVSPALFASLATVVKARLTRTPVAVWVQDIYSLAAAQTGRGGLASRVLRVVERTVLRNATRVVVIHDRFARHLSAELGVDPASISVVRNWSHVTPPSGVDRLTVRRRLGWQDDETVVLHAGNMGAKQGLENVIEASRIAERRGSRVRFVLMGDGNRRPALEAMGPNGRLSIIDPVSEADFMPTLAAADVLLVNELPGLTEMSVPSKLTSYFAAGRPVLAATDPSSVTSEEIIAAGAGVMADPRDPAELLDRAEWLGDHLAEAVAMGESAARFRAEHLSAAGARTRFADVLLMMRSR